MANPAVQGAIGGFVSGFAGGLRRGLPLYLQRKEEERKRLEAARLREELRRMLIEAGASEQRADAWITHEMAGIDLPYEFLQIGKEKVDSIVERQAKKLPQELREVVLNRYYVTGEAKPLFNALQQATESQIELNKGIQAMRQLVLAERKKYKGMDLLEPDAETGMTFYEALIRAKEPLTAVMTKEEADTWLQRAGIQAEEAKQDEFEGFFVNRDGSLKTYDQWSGKDFFNFAKANKWDVEKTKKQVKALYDIAPEQELNIAQASRLYSQIQSDLHNLDWQMWMAEKDQDLRKTAQKYAFQQEAFNLDDGSLKIGYFHKVLREIAAGRAELPVGERVMLEQMRREHTPDKSKSWWAKELRRRNKDVNDKWYQALPDERIDRLLEIFFAD